MRMVDHYNCTPEVYPVEIKTIKGEKAEPKIRQYPNMSVEYNEQPKNDKGGKTTFAFLFSSVGHSRSVASVSFILGDHDAIRFGIISDDQIMICLTCSPTSIDNVLHVHNRQAMKQYPIG